jgi:hypothetical protein
VIREPALPQRSFPFSCSGVGKRSGQQGLELQLVAQVRPHAVGAVAAVSARRGPFDEPSLLARPAASSSRHHRTPAVRVAGVFGFPSFMSLFPLSWKQSKGRETLYMTVVPNGDRRTSSTTP